MPSRRKPKPEPDLEMDSPTMEMPRTSPSELRHYPRAPLIAVVTVDGFGVFKSIDISENGLFLKVGKNTIPQGTFVKLQLESKVFDGPLELSGVVIRGSDPHEKNKGIGIHLIRMNPIHRRTIKAYIQAYFFTNK